MASEDEIFDKVREALVEALGVDDDEVTPEATLQGDLDAESIDFLDIVFRLEKSFDIKIERGELFPEDILTNTEYVEDGKVNRFGHRQASRADAVCRLEQVRGRACRAEPRPTADGEGHVQFCGLQAGGLIARSSRALARPKEFFPCGGFG